MHRLVAASLAAGLSVGLPAVASAADLGGPAPAPVYTKAPVMMPWTWTGFYGGVNAGGGWTHETLTTDPGGTLVTNPFIGSLNWGSSATSHNAGFTGGGQIGYNWQMNSFLVGVETDLQYYGAKANNNLVFAPTGSPTTTVANSITGETPWFGTLRARLGVLADPRFLIYGTGGLAYGQEKVSGTVSVTNAGTLEETFPFSMSKTAVGYTVGAGAEWKLDRSWSIKGEYLFVSLPKQSQTVATTTLGPAALTTDIMTLSSSRDDLNIVRMGLNYKFQ